uniref:Ulp1 protease family, C-terminal catalytic domain containing protein n=1 Tax=Solanum tuberosum TaxID=4113 RepID=M1A2L9_SOLTU
MPSNTNRVYDNEGLGWAENRSKKLHDPLVMANVSIEKVKRDVPSSKAKIGKTPKKKGGRKVSSSISRSNLSKSVKYKIKQIPTHSLRDCGLFVATFAEFLTDEIPIQSNAFRSDYHRTRYATLLWKYGSQKIEAGYVSHDNDDPSKPRRYFTPPDHDALVNLE